MQGIVIAALLLAPPPADDFCDTVTRIVAAAPGNFEALGGKRRTPTVAIWDTDLWLGDLYCSIKADSGDDGAPRTVECYSDMAEATDASQLALANRIAACVTAPAVKLPDWDARIPDPDAFRIDLPQARIAVSYSIIITTGRGPGSVSYFPLVTITPHAE